MADNNPNKSEGRFQLNLTNFAQYGKRWYDQEVFSEPMMIRGLPWRLTAVASTFSKKRYFGLFLKCDEESDDVTWSCKAKATLRIHSMAKGKEDFQFEFEKNFTADCEDMGYHQLKEFEELANPQNGWLDDEGVLYVSADVKAEPAHGMHFNNTMNGNDSIILNGTKFNVNKNHLLFYAPSFEPYFSPQRGIQLDPQLATVEDFKRMIAALPPQNRPLDDECIEAIMYLANRFSVGMVEGICRNYLAKNCKKSQIFKYRLATKYGFDLLKDRILKNITKKEVEEDIVQNLVDFRKLEKEDDADALIAHISLIFWPNLKNNSKAFIFGSNLNKNSTPFVFGGNLKSIAEVNGESPESDSSDDSDSSDNSNDDGEPALKRARQQAI